MTGEAESSESMNTERDRVEPFVQSLCVRRPPQVRLKLDAEANNLIDHRKGKRLYLLRLTISSFPFQAATARILGSFVPAVLSMAFTFALEEKSLRRLGSRFFGSDT